MKKKVVLFVAMPDSSHLARWLQQIASKGWELHLFPVYLAPIHPKLDNLTIHQPRAALSLRALKRIVREPSLLFRGGFGAIESSLLGPGKTVAPIASIPLPRRVIQTLAVRWQVSLGESGQKAPAAYGPKALAEVIRRVQPDLIHSLEFQHCGYNVLAARELVGKSFPPWLVSNWGSDIYYFRQFQGHRTTIGRLLKAADFYSCECERDVMLAQEFGFSGKIMPVMPNAGGFDLEQAGVLRTNIKPSYRKLILVKGYQSFAGRALTALDAIERCLPELVGFKVLVYSASPETRERVRELRQSTCLDIDILERTTHDTMLRMFSRARVYLGVSLSDGISTSMMEAMAMGAFPIQTYTACTNEWIRHGQSGFEIPPDNVTEIASRIREVVTNDQLVETAADINWKTVQERLNQSVLRQKVVDLYESIWRAIE